MARYIDADKFIKWIEKQKRLSKDFTIFMLQETATADVEEVKHGEWMAVKNENNHLTAFACSVCEKSIFEHATYRGYKYCPRCGAKMDGGK